MISFAEDTAIIYEDDSWEKLKSNAEKDLDEIFRWFSEKLLTFYIPFSHDYRALPEYTTIEVKVKNS